MSYVYFLEGEGRIKIGYSARPHARKKDLERAAGAQFTLIALYPGGLDEERREHQRWAPDRLDGEWFKATEQLREYAASIDVCLAEIPDDVAEAQVWVDYLLRRASDRLGKPKADMINVVAAEAGLPFSLIYSLFRQRLAFIGSADYRRLRDAHLREKSDELASLQDEVARLRATRDQEAGVIERLSDIPKLYEALGLTPSDKEGGL